MAKSTRAISLGVSALIVIALIVIVGLGAYLHATFNTAQTTTTIQISNMTESSHNSTITVVKSFPAETITEVLLIYSGTEGGEGWCESNFFPNDTTCAGMAIVQMTYSTTTTYINPLITQGYVNATFVQVTSYHNFSCWNATTSYTTFTSSGNNTRIDWTWSQTCS